MRKYKLESRRDFFKSFVQKTLPFIAIISCANVPFVLKASKIPMSCKASYADTGPGTCSTCIGTCYGSCSSRCTSCEGNCKGDCVLNCYSTCQGSCSSSCSGSCYKSCSGSSSKWLI